MNFFYIVFLFVIAQRMLELIIANQNEQWMKQRGGVIIAQEHYFLFIILHFCFLVSLFLEVALIGERPFSLNIYFFVLFLIVQLGRVWCIQSLGKFWNTKIIVIPKVILIKKGPYRFIKHPNYVIVFIELFTLSFMFGAYLTGILFPLLHLAVLMVRIPAEDRALGRRA